MVGRNAHLGHDLQYAFADGLDVVFLNLILAERQRAAQADFVERFKRDIGVDRLRAVAGQRAEMMHFPRFAGFHHQPGLHPEALPHQMMVNRGGRQKRRHRDPVSALRPVGQDEDVMIRKHGFGRSPAHFLDGERQTGSAGLRAPGHVDGFGPECPVERFFDRPDLRQIGIGQHRLVNLQPLVGSGIAPQQIRARADHRYQRHDQFLADGVYRRVGDLREILLEIIIEQPGPARENGNGRVGAHRPERVLPAGRHRLEKAGDIFLRISKSLLAIEQVGGAVGCNGFRNHFDVVQVLQLILGGLQPFGIGSGGRKIGLYLLILDNPALFGVDQQHLAGLETPFPDDIVFLDRENARFRGHDDMPVIGDAEPRWPQTIAVERCANLPPIGECNRRRSIPGLHQRGMILVERPPSGIHQAVGGPSLRHQHHHGMGKAVATSQQQLQRIVEAGGIRLAVRDQRPHFVEVSAQQFRFHRAPTGVHPVHIAANGVDLPVVRDEAVGMGQPPAGKGVGRKPLMHQR